MAALPASISDALHSLQKGAEAWRSMPDSQRAAVARACRAQLATLDMDWVPDNLRCIGIEPSKHDAENIRGLDPFIFVKITGDRLDSVARALEGSLKVPEPERQLPDGGPKIYNMGPVESQAAPKTHVELWTATAPVEPDTNATGKEGAAPGASIVLAAGNQVFLTAVDVAERAFMHKECVFLKHHPIRPFMAEAIAHIFKPLADCGAYAQCLDADVAGAYSEMVTHPAVTHVHMTGSGASHDRVVAALKAAGREEIGFTSELGCVSPWIVCPGKGQADGAWTEEALLHHAKILTAAFKSSCSMNCLSPKVLVLPREELWPQRPRFLELLNETLASKPQPPPYYPGAHTRFEAFAQEYPDAKKISAPPLQGPGDATTEPVYPGQDLRPLPSLLVEVGTIGSASCRSYALDNEAFAPVLAIGTVESSTAEEFPMAAARAVNEHLFGTLSCTIVSPERDAATDAAIKELNYGVVAVNMWAGFAYGNPLSIWGGAPGSYTREKPQSGVEFIGNHAKVPDVQKGVVVSPFVNKGLASDSPVPMIVWESLLILASGKSCVMPRILWRMACKLVGC